MRLTGIAPIRNPSAVGWVAVGVIGRAFVIVVGLTCIGGETLAVLHRRTYSRGATGGFRCSGPNLTRWM
jgi:hypothetical protein